MDPSRAQKQDGKVFEISDLNIVVHLLHPDYKLLPHNKAVLQPTGRLDLFELRPTSPDMPSFVARWDEGISWWRRKKGDLNIDIEGVSKREKQYFNKGKCGYSGHHSKRVPNATTYQVLIQIPHELILDATASFHVLRKMKLTATVNTRATISYKIVDRTKWWSTRKTYTDSQDSPEARALRSPAAASRRPLSASRCFSHSQTVK